MKPLLAATLENKDISALKFPCLASPKLDGIRCLIIDGVAVSRNLKPIRNKFVQDKIGKSYLNGLDGELIVGDPCDPMCYRNTSSGVMSEDGEPDFKFYVFDNFHLGHERDFQTRSLVVDNILQKATLTNNDHLVMLEHEEILNPEELTEYEETCLQLGYEGIMVRKPDGFYKEGRSTLKEGILLKLKRFLEDEAVVTGFKERMHNANEATINALGHTERSTHQENMVGRGDLGALEVTYKDKTFTIGSGFNDADRKKIWDNQQDYLGKTVTFKFMQYGEYDLPRFPVYKGFRDPIDLGTVE